MTLDLAFPTREKVASTYKKDRLYREGNGFFMYVRCGGCRHTTCCYSHSQTNISCPGCGDIILTSSGGRAIVSPNCEFKRIIRSID
ncbi:40S ribosomal protein S27 [Encephalitozoon intestinalis ATCC 50506]|uniref:40S ribosomal protein S27 n=1 Tax=Encephalitozoon intestinalis (strain ATCC 50506) TaxID=876142 RepID=E0S6Q3_ENCIT|nr:40S ribosomal protein S27 [Encephalitozoon intestinalis ATCC 50506]ADM11388.1 40S ribosomal protein S27 [Encephalitozoon intestinalis ATCC 50506]UTX45079.1 ribosomal protein S27 [Encephalitozoon intestinalis]